LGYYDIDTKFSLRLVMTNLCRGTCGAYKVSSPLQIEFFPYAWVKNRTLILFSFIYYVKILFTFTLCMNFFKVFSPNMLRAFYPILVQLAKKHFSRYLSQMINAESQTQANSNSIFFTIIEKFIYLSGHRPS
jgi:hypothetical protein